MTRSEFMEKVERCPIEFHYDNVKIVLHGAYAKQFDELCEEFAEDYPEDSHAEIINTMLNGLIIFALEHLDGTRI